MVQWRVAAFLSLAAFAAVCSAQDNVATIEEAGPRNPREDELPPPTLRRPQRPSSSSGSWSSLLSGICLLIYQFTSPLACKG